MAFNHYEWRTTRDALTEFYFLLGELNGFTEGTDEYETILDQIRSLNGFPAGAEDSDETDLFEIITTDVTIH